MRKHKRLSKSLGFSLIEMLVVVAMFSIIAIVVSQSTIVSLQGSRKSEGSAVVRENLNHAMQIVERQLRSARSVSPCTGASVQTINYITAEGASSSISCVVGTNGYISSGSARLTSQQTVAIDTCSFRCTRQGELPPSIEIIFEGRDKLTSGVESSTIRMRTQVNLRAY